MCARLMAQWLMSCAQNRSVQETELANKVGMSCDSARLYHMTKLKISCDQDWGMYQSCD